MITPQYLKKGDKIGIISTARKISREEVMPAIEIFKKWGLKVETGENLFSEYHQFAGTDEQRLADIQYMLDNPKIKAVICARGGYGTVRIIDKIDFSSFLDNPKWIAGFSDVTVLHSHIHTNYGIETLHSAMLLNIADVTDDSQSVVTLKDALFGNKLNYRINGHSFNRRGVADAVITGGNLSMLYSLIGSASDIDTKDKILFIEDLDEYLYHIDRMMMNLKRNGKLEQVAAMVVGGMNDMNDNDVPFGKTAYEIIHDVIEEYNFPVCYGFPAGHIKNNHAMIFGRKTRLEIKESVTLSF